VCGRVNTHYPEMKIELKALTEEREQYHLKAVSYPSNVVIYKELQNITR
jgi:hypothetical protein